MIRTFSTIFVLFLITSLTAQDKSIAIDIDQRLLKVYKMDYLQNLQEKHPELLERLNFYLDHSYYIIPFEKSEIEDLPVIEVENIDNFNILEYLEMNKTKIKRHYQKNRIYRIKGSNLALHLFSGKEAMKKFNKHWNNL